MLCNNQNKGNVSYGFNHPGKHYKAQKIITYCSNADIYSRESDIEELFKNQYFGPKNNDKADEK